MSLVPRPSSPILPMGEDEPDDVPRAAVQQRAAAGFERGAGCCNIVNKQDGAVGDGAWLRDSERVPNAGQTLAPPLQTLRCRMMGAGDGVNDRACESLTKDARQSLGLVEAAFPQPHRVQRHCDDYIDRIGQLVLLGKVCHEPAEVIEHLDPAVEFRQMNTVLHCIIIGIRSPDAFDGSVLCVARRAEGDGVRGAGCCNARYGTAAPLAERRLVWMQAVPTRVAEGREGAVEIQRGAA